MARRASDICFCLWFLICFSEVIGTLKKDVTSPKDPLIFYGRVVSYHLSFRGFHDSFCLFHSTVTFILTLYFRQMTAGNIHTAFVFFFNSALQISAEYLLNAVSECSHWNNYKTCTNVLFVFSRIFGRQWAFFSLFRLSVFQLLQMNIVPPALDS